MRILFVTSEAEPLMKTGGLADVSAHLPAALAGLGHDVRILMPAYADTLDRAPAARPVPRYRPPVDLPETALQRCRMPGSGVPVHLLDGPGFADRRGNPYHDAEGTDYPDNAARFNALSRVAAAIADDAAGLRWRPHVVHCNDWQTGLTPVWMMLHRVPAAILFTVHNLQYQGLFPSETLAALGLPAWLWHYRALEFRGLFSFIKGGLVFAERLSTVSPGYAREIRTAAHGEGLQGLLDDRGEALTGILNGIDTETWNPQTDPCLARTYGPDHLDDKRANRQALQQETGLDSAADCALAGMVTRLVPQKGIDLLVAALPRLMEQPLQLVLLGSGMPALERDLRAVAARYPGRIALRLGYDDGLAHRIEAGADMFLMPSRFEPCGLNQMYSLRYGTVPVVRRTGGLADSVTDATPEALREDRATGIVFDEPSPEALVEAVARAIGLYRNRDLWHRIMRAGMEKDFSWTRSAAAYADLYADAIASRKAW
ncbi:MAG TPA: glycogen synthase GlgA [Gammaproteobacteria bacterium]|nr:glycogen synthase GlgA [Gammaproteobacteria bacterium]